MKGTIKTDIKRLTKGKLPRLPFDQFKNAILGKNYELSIVFVGSALSQKLNKQFRGKNYPTNILSFSLSKNSGELFVSLKKVREEAREHGMTYKKFLPFLLIHGMLHLKGYDHGSTMESEEEKFRKKFGI